MLVGVLGAAPCLIINQFMKLKWSRIKIIGKILVTTCMSNNKEYEIGKLYYDSVYDRVLRVIEFISCDQQNDTGTIGCHECSGYPQFIHNGRRINDYSPCKKIICRDSNSVPYLRLQYKMVQNTNERW